MIESINNFLTKAEHLFIVFFNLEFWQKVVSGLIILFVGMMLGSKAVREWLRRVRKH